MTVLLVRDQASTCYLYATDHTQKKNDTASTGSQATFVCICTLLPMFESILKGTGDIFDSDVMLSKIIL